jgi:hypothetical protein
MMCKKRLAYIITTIGLIPELLKLKEGEHRVIYNSPKGVSVTVKHTGKFSTHDFAIGLAIPDKEEFYPTHIRLLIDLYIKRSSNPKAAHQLYFAFEGMYQGVDPEKLLDKVNNLEFPMKFDEPIVNLYYSQLLMIEQDINYGPGSEKQSKLDPPREYLMRFIRWTADDKAEIDKIIFAAAGRRYPAPVRYSTPIS